MMVVGGRHTSLPLIPCITHTHTHTISQSDWCPPGGDSAVLRVLHRNDCSGDLHQLLRLLEGEWTTSPTSLTVVLL